MFGFYEYICFIFSSLLFFSSRRRHTRCALVTGVQTCALPISVEEICRFFGVPPFMVGHTEKSTSWGTGLEQQTLGFQKFTLRRRLKRIEQALEKQILTPRDRADGITIEFNLEGLLRADSSARADFYREMRSEEHTSELQSLMRISSAVFCLKKTTKKTIEQTITITKHKTAKITKKINSNSQI